MAVFIPILSEKEDYDAKRIDLSGTFCIVFEPCSVKSGKYRAYVDGHLVIRRVGRNKKRVFEFDASAKRFGGGRQHAQVIATGLDPEKVHTLEIEPLFTGSQPQELRFESICVAGGQAKVWLDK